MTASHSALRRLATAAFACLATSGGLLGAATPAAFAGRGWASGGYFGSKGSGNGQLESPRGAAVNEASGDVYVVDESTDRVERFDANGNYLGQFNGSGTYEVQGKTETGPAAPSGTLSAPTAVAVDNACVRHNPVLSESTSPTCHEYDPSGGDVYVVDAGHHVVDKFSATGGYVGDITESRVFVYEAGKGQTCEEAFAKGEYGEYTPFTKVIGVAVDPRGRVFVDQQELEFETEHEKRVFERVSIYTSELTNGFIGQRCSGGISVVDGVFAVDGEDNWYQIQIQPYGGGVRKSNSEGHELGFFDEGAEADGLAVEAVSNDVYVDNLTEVVRFASSGAERERIGAGDLSHGTGVAVNRAGLRLYVADAQAGRVAMFVPEPPGAPVVVDRSVREVGDATASLSAEIDPHGEATEYSFQYGRCGDLASCPGSPYEASLPVAGATLAADYEDHAVTVQVEGVAPLTPYHFRVVAHNALGETASEEETFTTQALGSPLSLLDGRQWELVSPPDKHGQLIQGLGEFLAVTQASSSGEAMTYFASGPTEDRAQGNEAGGVQVLSRRGAQGWSSQDIATPNLESTGYAVGQGQEYRFFSEDLSSGVVEPRGAFAQLSACDSSGCVPESFPQATEQTVYLRHDETCASDVATCYEPLVTGANGYADVPAGTEFAYAVRFQGASPDAEHVVVSSLVALTGEPFEAGREPSGIGGTALYEWSASKPYGERLRLVSVLPESEGGKGIVQVRLGADTGVGGVNGNTRNAVSSDGNRVFWEDENGHLYVRDLARRETVRIGGKEAVYQTASADGSRVFFTEGGSLYVCDVVLEAEKLVCKTTDLTPGGGGAVKLAPGASQDGSFVYFVDTDVVTSEPNVAGETAQPGAFNLYVDHYDSQAGAWEAPRLVAVLAPEDSSDWGQLTSKNAAFLARVTARVSPSGRFLAFMSSRSLTGYDTRDAVSGRRDEEVYLYDHQTGRVSCGSCNPTGARPLGRYNEGFLTEKLIGSSVKGWFSGVVPGYPKFMLNETRHQPRYLSDEGRLFFDSTEALVPQDVNGQIDVYEYEPAGVGSCAASSAAYSERDGGCVGLISSGRSAVESALFDASESGGDVFFLTATKLLGADYDTAYDVYDAHECTSASPCFAEPATTPPPCASTDSCREAPQRQPGVFAAPSSATFSGAGNPAPPPTPAAKAKTLTRAQRLAKALKACHRQRMRKRRSVCERRARKRYGAGRSSRHGRASGRRGR